MVVKPTGISHSSGQGQGGSLDLPEEHEFSQQPPKRHAQMLDQAPLMPRGTRPMGHLMPRAYSAMWRSMLNGQMTQKQSECRLMCYPPSNKRGR